MNSVGIFVAIWWITLRDNDFCSAVFVASQSVDCGLGVKKVGKLEYWNIGNINGKCQVQGN